MTKTRPEKQKDTEISDETTEATETTDTTETSESSEKSETKFLTNTNLSGYDMFSTPSNSSKGGVALFSNSSFNVIERFDLKSSSNHFESVWIEIKNTRSKNIICAAIYRHPHNNNIPLSSFFEYLEHALQKVISENKQLYICGDFNFDLHKIDLDEQIYNFFRERLSIIILMLDETDRSYQMS